MSLCKISNILYSLLPLSPLNSWTRLLLLCIDEYNFNNYMFGLHHLGVLDLCFPLEKLSRVCGHTVLSPRRTQKAAQFTNYVRGGGWCHRAALITKWRHLVAVIVMPYQLNVNFISKHLLFMSNRGCAYQMCTQTCHTMRHRDSKTKAWARFVIKNRMQSFKNDKVMPSLYYNISH